jgi:hypothetical protein
MMASSLRSVTHGCGTGSCFFAIRICRRGDFLRFGNTIEYPFIKGLQAYPEIILVVKHEHEKMNFGGVWRSDTAYLDVPPLATMRIARQCPPMAAIPCLPTCMPPMTAFPMA